MNFICNKCLINFDYAQMALMAVLEVRFLINRILAIDICVKDAEEMEEEGEMPELAKTLKYM